METLSALPAFWSGNSPVTGEIPSERSVTRSSDVSLICALNKRLSKQSWGWWLETLPCPLWRHCNNIKKSCWFSIKYGATRSWPVDVSNRYVRSKAIEPVNPKYYKSGTEQSVNLATWRLTAGFRECRSHKILVYNCSIAQIFASRQQCYEVPVNGQCNAII